MLDVVKRAAAAEQVVGDVQDDALRHRRFQQRREFLGDPLQLVLRGQLRKRYVVGIARREHWL